MQSLRRYVTATCFFLLLFAKAVHAYYPVGCFYEDNGNGYAVVGVKKGKPFALINNKEKRFKATEVRFQRLEVYGDGFITIKEASAYFTNTNLRSITTDHDGKNPPNRGFVDVEFEATKDLEDCYALVFSGTEAGMNAIDLDELFVDFHAIGKVKSGETYKKTFSALFATGTTRRRGQQYFVIFYDQGMPLRSKYDTIVTEHFINRNQREHSFYLKQYLDNNTDKTLKHQGFFTYTPYLPTELYEETGSIDAKAVINILSNGKTTVESISGIENSAAQDFIKERISEWLFFPALEAGKARETKTAVRIQY